jgi:uncharacterized damage-inducible protein DinB
LLEPVVHIPPSHALEGLRAEDAERRVAGANHSIAELVAHMAFWQEWFYRRCQGRAEPMIANAAAGWPTVESGIWPAIHDRFRDGLERLVALDGCDDRITPPIEFPPLAQYTIRDALTHVAQHNSHHLGQVVLLRQILGLWPPPFGSWTF